MYYAAIVDQPGLRCKCVSVRHTIDEVLACELVGRNPRIVKIPDSIVGSDTEILHAIAVADARGESVRIGSKHG